MATPTTNHYQLDPEWDKSLATHWTKIQDSNIVVVSPEKQRLITFGVLLEVPPVVQAEIYTWLSAHIPKEYTEYIIWQPAKGYHVSLEWTEKDPLSPEQTEKLLTELKEQLKQYKALTGTISLVHPSSVNLFAPYLVQNNELEQIRDCIRTVFQKYNLRIGIPQTVYGAWISLIRFCKPLPADLITRLQQLPKTTIPNVTFNRILFTHNDQMFTPEASTVLDSITLQAGEV